MTLTTLIWILFTFAFCVSPKVSFSIYFGLLFFKRLIWKMVCSSICVHGRLPWFRWQVVQVLVQRFSGLPSSLSSLVRCQLWSCIDGWDEWQISLWYMVRDSQAGTPQLHRWNGALQFTSLLDEPSTLSFPQILSLSTLLSVSVFTLNCSVPFQLL